MHVSPAGGGNEIEVGGPCRKKADVLFLIDTTSNMDYDYFNTYMLGFVTELVSKLEVDTGRTRVAVISFSDGAQVCLASGNDTVLVCNICTQ